MNKSQISKEISKRLEEKMFVSPTQLRKITGFGVNKVAAILDGLEYLEDGQGKRYFVPEVAERLADMRCG